jgi:hypothetical protein
MSERAYTVSEIDELRRACEQRWLYGTTCITTNDWGRGYRGNEKDIGVEQMVRTFMVGGIVAEDIYAEDQAKSEEKVE